MKPYLLLIEDDELLGSSLVDNLQMEGFTVDWIQDGDSGLAASEKGIHDLIVLDIMIPKLNGLELLKKFRKKSNTPVIILSAKSSTEDKILGLELAADDYLAKPFHFKELLLRINALIKRSQIPVTQSNIVTIGPAIFDFKSLKVIKNNQEDFLTEKEVLLLKLLLAHQNQVVSRDKILNQVWGMNQYPSTRTIDNIIVKLRKWIEDDPSDPKRIRSHRGIGYALVET